MGFLKPKMPKMPEPKVVRMPKPMDPEIREAAKRTRLAALQRQGRASTILTDQLKDRTQSRSYLG